MRVSLSLFLCERLLLLLLCENAYIPCARVSCFFLSCVFSKTAEKKMQIQVKNKMSREEEEKGEEEKEEKEKQKRATIASAPDDDEQQNLPIFLAEKLRKAATDRREKASIARSRKGELNAQKKAAEEEAGVSYLKFAARATEMTRTQKRINRGGY